MARNCRQLRAGHLTPEAHSTIFCSHRLHLSFLPFSLHFDQWGGMLLVRARGGEVSSSFTRRFLFSYRVCLFQPASMQSASLTGEPSEMHFGAQRYPQ